MSKTDNKAPVIVMTNPAENKIHGLVKDLPWLEDDDADFLALCDEALRKDGVMTPGFATERRKIIGGEEVVERFIVAGRHRNKAFRFAQRDFPVIIISEAEAAHVALKENTLRNSLLKFQVAFSYYPLIVKVATLAKERQAANLAGKASESPVTGLSEGPQTLEALADSMSISRAWLFEAKQTYEMLVKFDAEHEPQYWPESPKKKLTAMAYYRPRILRKDKPMNLGGVRAGLGGKTATEGKERGERPLEKVLISSCVTITNQMAELGSLDELKPEERKALREDFSKQFLTQRNWTKKQCEEAAHGLKELAKEFERMASQAPEKALKKGAK